jgi:hypothetical protein
MQPGGSDEVRSSRTSHSSQTSQTSQTSGITGGPRRQSGGPISGGQPPQDTNKLGLPDLTGPAPRLTPRVATTAAPNQPQQPVQQPPPQQPAQSSPGQANQSSQSYTLGITSKLAQTRTTSAPANSPSIPPPPARGPVTLSQKIRSVAPPDVARQTLEEQKMLASELLTLPDALEAAGLAKTHERSYIEAIRGYVDLADETWVAVAEERLEQSAADQPYRQNAIVTARRIQRMRNECDLAANNTQFQLPRKRPFFWRRRVQMNRTALLQWQSNLNSPADPRLQGTSLAYLRGATALTQASGLELLLWSLFPAAVGDAVMVLWLGFIISLIAAIAQGTFAAVGPLALAATGTLAARILLELFMRRGPARLDHLFALSAYSTLHSPRAATAGSRSVAMLVRAWGILILSVGLLGMLAALGYSVWKLDVTLPVQALDWIALVGALITHALWLPSLVGVMAIGVLALPLLLLSAFRFFGELSGNIAWVPAARHYALAPALHVLVSVAAGIIATLAVLAPQIRLREIVLVHFAVGPVTESITLQTVALIVVPALLLYVSLDVPYRVGIVRWRHHWLNELSTRRTDIDADVRRRSAIDPHTGVQDSSDENLRALQYNLTLVQFYATRSEETRRVSTAPYGIFARIGVVVLLVVVALLVDGLAQQLAHLLLNVG